METQEIRAGTKVTAQRVGRKYPQSFSIDRVVRSVGDGLVMLEGSRVHLAGTEKEWHGSRMFFVVSVESIEGQET